VKELELILYWVRFEVFMAVAGKNYNSEIKNSIVTSQETHHVSATELSPLMLCKI
jgi:hypothetical protein